MASPRFVLASVSLPSGGLASGDQPCQSGLAWGTRSSAASPHLLAYINAPASLSLAEPPAEVEQPEGPSRQPNRQPSRRQPVQRPTSDGASTAEQPKAQAAQPQAQQQEGTPPQPSQRLVGGGNGLSPQVSNRHVLLAKGEVDDTGSVAIESSAGGRRRRVYMPRTGSIPNSEAAGSASTVAAEAGGFGFDILDERQNHEDFFQSLVHSYLLPNGFPDSVAPQYAPYMAWRGVQYFFGGAMSVFTTQSLLGALGVAGRYSGEAAAAINWVIKDGAGRLGRLLFARWGRELDCELKQFRLAGDLLMEAGAALELATVYAPSAFLPLACTANLAKNLAAVAASATRAPIYRTFARANNLADITAKGESVANLADILGTLAGIALSRAALPAMPTFCALSAGYLLASRREVDSVELPYMNRARLAYSCRRYLADGAVPGVGEANRGEPLLPWGRYNQGRLVLGASVEAACRGPGDLGYAARLFGEGSYRYMVTYRPDTQQAYVLLREGATSMDCLHASFFGHVFLHLMDGGGLEATAARLGLPVTAPARDGSAAAATAAGCAGTGNGCKSQAGSGKGRCPSSGRHAPKATERGQGPAGSVSGACGEEQQGGKEAWRDTMVAAQAAVAALYPDFLAQAEARGWKLGQTMLNPRENRILRVTTPLVA